MNRRKFITAVGASTVLPVASRAAGKPVGVGQVQRESGRLHIDLAGVWERFIAGNLYDRIPVPSSERPLGFYELKRNFVLPALSTQQRAIIHFNAITYYGQVFVNGAEVGTMGPYVPYEFDFTPQAKEGSNQLVVAIADLTSGPKGEGRVEAAFGMNPGWECYGGIIREVYVEVRPAAFIDNVRFGYQLNPDRTQASCQATVFISARKVAAGKVTLEHFHK